MSTVVTQQDKETAIVVAGKMWPGSCWCSNCAPFNGNKIAHIAQAIADAREAGEAKGRDEGRSKAFVDLLAAMRVVARNASDWSWVERIEAFTEADAITRQGGAL